MEQQGGAPGTDKYDLHAAVGKDKYDLHEAVGTGTYGTVYRAQRRRDGAWVAIKAIHANGGGDGVPATSLREIIMLMAMKHPHIVALFDVVHVKQRLTLIFEFMQTDLHRTIKTYRARNKWIPLTCTQRLFTQLLSAVAFLHAHNVAHRDIKPNNLLLTHDNCDDDAAPPVLRLADFGLARPFTLPARANSCDVVTLWYQAPELILGDAGYCGATVDAWSVGCVLGELLNSRPLFRGIETAENQLRQICLVRGSITDTVWPGVSALPRARRLAAAPKRQAASAWATVVCHPEYHSIPPPPVRSVIDTVLEGMLCLNPAHRFSAADALEVTSSSSPLPSPSLSSSPSPSQ